MVESMDTHNSLYIWKCQVTTELILSSDCSRMLFRITIFFLEAWFTYVRGMPATHTCGVLQAYENTHRRFVAGATGSHKGCRRYAERVDWSSTFPARRQLSGGVLWHIFVIFDV